MSIKGLKIARVSTVPFFVVTQLSAQLRSLNAAGANVHVIASNDDMQDSIRAMTEVKFLPLRIEREISPFSDVLSLFQLVRLFREHDYDIVHSTTPKAGLLTAIAGRIAGVKVRLHTFTGQPWVTMSGPKRMLLKWCDKIIGILNTHCYTDSFSQRDFLIASNVTSADKISVIGDGSIAGVDIKRFDAERFPVSENMITRGDLGIPANARVLLFVGRVTPEKGVRELVRAFSILALDYPDLYMVLVGPFEAGGESLVNSGLAGELKTRVKMLGLCVDPEKYMAIADFLCLPSYREGFGTVVIEAAAMGLPAIGTAIYGLTDAIVDGETGLLVPVEDAEALAVAIEKLLCNPDLLKRMAATAKERARQNFDSARSSALLVKEYEAFHNES